MTRLDFISLGIQRPLEVIYDETKSIYIPRGINVPALNRKKPWEFNPSSTIRVNFLDFSKRISFLNRFRLGRWSRHWW